MKTARLIAVALLALASASTFATTCKNGGTNWPTCTPPSKPTDPSISIATQSSSSAQAAAEAAAAAQASVSGSLSATGGSSAGGTSSLSDFSRQNMYVMPAPVQAAPLPPGLCPQGDSMSIGILWNLFSFSQSSTRTEMQCLDKVLAAIKPVSPVVQQTLAPLTLEEKATLERLDRESKDRAAAAGPAATTSAAAASPGLKASSAVKKPEVAKAPPKKATSKPTPTSSCEETALQSCKAPKKT